jgi:hypothetical protein
MKQIILNYLALVLSISLMACGQPVIPNSITPTISSVPTKTAIVVAPSSMVDPQQASLSGIVMLVYPGVQGGKAFGFSTQLYQHEEFKLIRKSSEDSFPFFDFQNIQPGKYELWLWLPNWVLGGLTGCEDIELPDDQWKLGRLIDGSQPLILEEVSYREAVDSNDRMRDDIYAVFDNLEIKSGIDRKFDVNFMCKKYK